MFLSSTSYYIKQQQQEVFIKEFLPCTNIYIGIYNIGTNYFVLFGNQKVGSILEIENSTIFFEFKQQFYQIQATPIPIILSETTNIKYDQDQNIGITDKSGYTITLIMKYTENEGIC